MKTMTAAEAQNGFDDLLDNIAIEPVEIISDEGENAVIMSPKDYENLISGKKQETERS